MFFHRITSSGFLKSGSEIESPNISIFSSSKSYSDKLLTVIQSIFPSIKIISNFSFW